MIFREAQEQDIEQIQVIRNSVKENKLSNPALVSDADVKEFITNRGKGWVCEIDGKIGGFAIADIIGKNIWALFLHPDYEGIGMGKILHHNMLDWYFTQTKELVWFSTSPESRAAIFYKMQGWKEIGTYGKDEIKFEMTIDDWKAKVK